MAGYVIFYFGRPGARVRGPRRRANARGEWPDFGVNLSAPRPAALPRGGAPLIFKCLHPAIRPAPSAPRRGHCKRFGRRSGLPLAVPHALQQA